MLFGLVQDSRGVIFHRMNPNKTTDQTQVWLFDGKPEYVDVKVASAFSTEGGYIIALELADGAIRLAATRYPAKYVTAWRHNVKRYGLPDVLRVLVSRPYIRYEAVKRSLAKLLFEHRDDESDGYRLAVDTLTEKARTMLTDAGI
jgi:hypothetical protein